MVAVTIDMAATLQFIINDVKNILNEMSSANFIVLSEDKSKYTGDFEDILTAMEQLKRQMVDTLQSVSEASAQVKCRCGQFS